MTVQQFEVVLAGADEGPASCAVPLPFDAKTVFGRARMPVHVTIDDHPPFRTSVATYGGVGWIGLRKDQQAAFGVSAGDKVRVRLEPDTEPRTVEPPPELAVTLAGAPDAAAVYEKLSFTHRREYARWVGDAKRQQTRDDRAHRAIELLRSGVRTPG